MRKFFVILGFFAFTFNVKADYAPIDIQIAEGEEYQIDQIVASQVINQTGWDGQYILTGGVARIYIDFLPRQWPDGRENILFYGWYVEQKPSGGWWLYHEGEGGSARAPSITFDSPFDAYQWLISDEGIEYCGYWMTTQDDEDGLGEYLDTSYMSTIGYRNSTSSDSANWVLEKNQDSLSKMQNRMQFLTQTDLLNYSQVPINGVRITITNSQGQATSSFDTNMVVKLDQILQQVTRIKNDTSTIVSELMFLANAFGFDGSVGSSTSNLAEFLGQWRTADGVWQGEIFDVITNFANQADYTDWMNLVLTTNITPLVAFYNDLIGTKNGNKTLSIGELRQLLGGSSYYTAWSQASQNLRNNSSFSTDTSMLGLLYYLERYQNMENELIEYRKYGQLTNIINGVDLGRDWLNLATNDISSLPYWLNQQDYSPVGGTNSASFTRFDVITNQYAHIGLTGSGQQANSTETWNYFKRLEMLLAALVYKQTDYEGKIDPHESGNNASVSSSVSTGEDQINTSLSAVKDALTLSTIGNAKNNIVSLFQTATSAFDVNGSKRVINVMETDVATGNESAGVTVNVDFTQGELGDFADFVHHLFGFAWGFGSLFIFWRVCKFCWDMGYKVVKFHYSLCRKFLGI